MSNTSIPKADETPDISLEQIKILYLEDQIEDVELVKIHLEDSLPHAEVAAVADFGVFKQKLDQDTFHLVLSDFNIVGVKGKEVLEWVKQFHPDIPFIYVTGALGDEMVVDVLRSGARDYVLKDNLDKLPLAIVRALKEQREHAEREEARAKIDELNRSLEKRVEQRTKELLDIQKDLKESLERERELGKIKSRFISVASHQFRTPLTVIKSNMDILALKVKDQSASYQAQFQKSYERIDRQITRLTGLMDDVLILGKGQSGVIQPDLKPIDLVQLIREIVDQYNSSAKDTRQIEVVCSGTPRTVKADRALMEHALSNLVSNAIKYSASHPEAPSVTIGFNDHCVEIMVEDHGIGIPEDELQNVFNPFYRASNSEGFEGNGLGMSIVKEYIELCNGSIQIQSELNKGTTVQVLIHTADL